MNRQELERLTQGMADGSLSEEELTLLGRELESNSNARDFYRRSMKVELLFSEALQRSSQPTPVVAPNRQRRLIVPPQTQKPSRVSGQLLSFPAKRRPLLRFAMAAAVVMLSAVLFHQVFLRDSGPSIHVAFSPGTSWSGPVDDDGRMPFGETLKIEFGVAEFDLPGDVRAVIEGPAEIELPDPALLVLREGSGWFQVGEDGQGFRVLTPSVEVVDYGTRFGLLARPNEPAEVHVFDGLVNCAARFAMKESEDLQEGRSLRVSPAGRWIEQELDEQKFLTSLPHQLPGIRFSFDGEDPLMPEGEHPSVKGMKVAVHRGGEARLTEGVQGKALSIRERDDVVKTNWPGIGGSASRTIACWIRPTRGNKNPFAGIVSWGDPSDKSLGKCHFMIGKSRRSENRFLRFAVGDSIQFSGSTPIVYGEWQHIALVFRGTGNIDGDMVELYLNGEREQVAPEFSRLPEDDSVISTVIDGARSQPLQIGSGPFPGSTGGRFFGAIDEVWIHPRALSAREVRGLMGSEHDGASR
ncbi:LamG-like jellyroll fold domain-containing protein [Haloferula sp.]|uniref:LamG-like jellyroll fold domain-containing protein n=1 Tax=Haloferula sp. TaxID=2497595 RepID=UPI0032A02C44